MLPLAGTIPVASADPVLLGTPVAVLALLVGGLGCLLSIAALVWQLVRYLLDGGRVKVFLNHGVLEDPQPDSGGLFIQHDGRWPMVWRGQRNMAAEHFEVAQLVIENPGRIAVTIVRPAIYATPLKRRSTALLTRPRIARWGHPWHRNSGAPPRLEAPWLSVGAPATSEEVRLEPYARVTYLLHYWQVVPRLREMVGSDAIRLRGGVQVPGRRWPRLSPRSRAWVLPKGSWTGLHGTQEVAPRTVMYRALYLGLSSEPAADSIPDLPRSGAALVLRRAMGEFTQEPTDDAFRDAIARSASTYGRGYKSVGFIAHLLKIELDHHRDHLGKWA